MCLSASQVLAAWIAAPDQLDPTYRAFLDKHGALCSLRVACSTKSNSTNIFARRVGGKHGHSQTPFYCEDGTMSTEYYKGLRSYVPILPVCRFQTDRNRSSWGNSGTPLREGMLSCDIVHADQPRQCFRHFGTFFVAAVRRAIPVYVTLYGVFAVSGAIRHAFARRAKRLASSSTSSSDAGAESSNRPAKQADVTNTPYRWRCDM